MDFFQKRRGTTQENRSHEHLLSHQDDFKDKLELAVVTKDLEKFRQKMEDDEFKDMKNSVRSSCNGIKYMEELSITLA